MTQRPASEPRRFLQSLNMSLDVLETIAQSDRPLGTTEIAVRLGLSKGAVHTVLANLEARGYIGRHGETSSFTLGRAAWELGRAAGKSFDIRQLVHEELMEIHQLTGETAQIASYISRNEVVFLHRIVSTHPVKAAIPIGDRVSATTVASGHVLLAFQPDSEIDAVLATPLPRVTHLSVTDPAVMRATLMQVRDQGYAITSGTHYLDTVSVYVPVRDQTGDVIYALGVYGPDYRLPEPVVKALIPQLHRIAGKLSRKLGYQADTLPP